MPELQTELLDNVRIQSIAQPASLLGIERRRTLSLGGVKLSQPRAWPARCGNILSLSAAQTLAELSNLRPWQVGSIPDALLGLPVPRKRAIR